jgi:CMP-N-acetylneuraminic acid synthetase
MSTARTHVAIIPAKSHSSRCPDKNWRPFAGGPCLVARTAAGLPAGLFARTIISTDRDGYEPPAGCTLHRRAAALATVDADVQTLLPVLIEQYALYDSWLWLLNPTAPFRRAADYDAICKLIDAGAPAVVSLTPVGSFVWRGGAPQFATSGRRPNTQDLPRDLAAENGMFYVFRAADFVRHGTWYVPGVRSYVQTNPLSRIDIDTPEDFEQAERLAAVATDAGPVDLLRRETLAIEHLVAAPRAAHVTLLANHFKRYFAAAEALAISPSDRVIDASCGKGYGAYLLAQQAGHVVGLDIAIENLDCARREFADGRVEFCTYDEYFASPRPPADKLVCVETLEHIPRVEAPAFVRRVLKTLRPGGDAFFTFPLGDDGPSAANPHHLNEPRLESADALLAPRFRSTVYEIATRVDSFGVRAQFCCATLRGHLGEADHA